MNQLVFVYNADSDLFSTVTDFAHKIISPKTYACSLCSLTFGHFGMKKEWSEFIKTMHPSPEFLHKDEFIRKYDAGTSTGFPAIYGKEFNEMKLLVSSFELNACKTIADLRQLIMQRLQLNQ